MVKPAVNYIPQSIPVALQRQALVVWAIAAFLVFFWVLATVLPPITLELGYAGLSRGVYGFFSYICHQKPERSFFIDGHQFAVCTRCFGVYFGLLAGLLVYPLWRSIQETEPLPRIWLFLSLVPIGFDWSLGVFGVWDNTHWSRFVSGLILGAACATFIVPALVEIVRNFTVKRRRKGR